MLTRLIEGGIPCPVLVSGVIWGLWHVPLIVTGLYVASGQQSMVVTLSVFMVGATAFAFVLARFRSQTGSIWPVIVLHGAWNSVIQSAFDPAVAGPGAPLWLGESGILVALTLVGAALLISLGRWRMLGAPGQPLLVTPGRRDESSRHVASGRGSRETIHWTQWARLPRSRSPPARQRVRHDGDHAEPPTTTDHRRSAACAAFWNPTGPRPAVQRCSPRTRRERPPPGPRRDVCRGRRWRRRAVHLAAPRRDRPRSAQWRRRSSSPKSGWK